MAEIVTTSRPSVELSRNAKGEVAVVVKCYGEVGEEEAAATKAQEIFDRLSAKYGKTTD